MSKTINDLYLIAALISYGFEPEHVDDTNRDQQKYLFSVRETQKVYTLQPDGRSRWDMLDVKAVDRAYSANKLLFPPNYPEVLRKVKYAIVSKKHEDDSEYDN